MTGKIVVLSVLIGAVLAAAAGAASAPVVVPRLAFVTGKGGSDSVFLSNLDGTQRRRVGAGDNALLAPSGRAVAAASFGVSGPALVLYTVGAPARKYLDVRKETVSVVSWSPDSRYLAVEVFGSDVKGKLTPSGVDVVDTATNTIRVISRGYPCGASFAPDLPDRLVYSNSPAASFCFKGRVNVFTIAADGSGRKQLTSDGASLNPVFGPNSIAFDRETLRGNDAPVFQIWTMRPDGTKRTQVTRLKVPPLLDGLVPLQFDAAGDRLLAEFEGQDTTGTYTIDLARHRVRQLTVGRTSVSPSGISRDGKTVLVCVGQFMNPPSSGKVETIPFGGGPATLLAAHASDPSWNR
jgi:hypothetical protein